MKLMKRSNTYQASNYNVTFDPNEMTAFSYKWWKFVARINGKIVFNSYRYSVSTSKHQAKVRGLMSQLGIKIDLFVSCPKGLQNAYAAESALIEAYRAQDFSAVAMIEKTFKTKLETEKIEELYIEMEEQACDKYLNGVFKRDEKKAKDFAKKLEEYLENSVCFRDYDIEDASKFGTINKIAVHQVVDAKTMEGDVENALYNFHRDGFGSVVFYIGAV